MAQKITSAANPLIKTLKALHTKKGRSETGLFLAEGARSASEAASLGVWPDILLIAEAALARPQVRTLLERAEAEGVRCVETSEGLLGQISKRDNPQTVIGAYRQRLTPLASVDCELMIAVEAMRDPGNLGTVLRTADSIGASGVVQVDGGCDPFSVEAVRASMGSIFSTKLARCSLAELQAHAKANEAMIVGASLNGAPLQDAWATPERVIVFMGNEQSGLSPAHEEACDMLVKLPMRGRADSLNVAIATAVLGYDIWRRREYEGARA